MTTDSTPTANAMGQCSITGKIVPEDELIMFQGHRVCAEGKAILLDRLKSGEAMPGEREKPTVLKRFGCIFLDGLIIGVPLGIINALLAAHGSMAWLGIAALAGTVIQVIYFGQLHSHGGQSVGKMAGKLVVANMDGSPISTRTAYIRAIAYIGIGILNGIAILSGDKTFIPIASTIVSVWFLADSIFALVDRTTQRALHDRIAGTRVVQKG